MRRIRPRRRLDLARFPGRDVPDGLVHQGGDVALKGPGFWLGEGVSSGRPGRTCARRIRARRGWIAEL